MDKWLQQFLFLDPAGLKATPSSRSIPSTAATGAAGNTAKHSSNRVCTKSVPAKFWAAEGAGGGKAAKKPAKLNAAVPTGQKRSKRTDKGSEGGASRLREAALIGCSKSAACSSVPQTRRFSTSDDSVERSGEVNATASHQDRAKTSSLSAVATAEDPGPAGNPSLRYPSRAGAHGATENTWELRDATICHDSPKPPITAATAASATATTASAAIGTGIPVAWHGNTRGADDRRQAGRKEGNSERGGSAGAASAGPEGADDDRRKDRGDKSGRVNTLFKRMQSTVPVNRSELWTASPKSFTPLAPKRFKRQPVSAGGATVSKKIPRVSKGGSATKVLEDACAGGGRKVLERSQEKTRKQAHIFVKCTCAPPIHCMHHAFKCRCQCNLYECSCDIGASLPGQRSLQVSTKLLL